MASAFCKNLVDRKSFIDFLIQMLGFKLTFINGQIFLLTLLLLNLQHIFNYNDIWKRLFQTGQGHFGSQIFQATVIYLYREGVTKPFQ